MRSYIPKALTAGSKNSGVMPVHKQGILSQLGALWSARYTNGYSHYEIYRRRIAIYLASALSLVWSTHTHCVQGDICCPHWLTTNPRLAEARRYVQDNTTQMFPHCTIPLFPSLASATHRSSSVPVRLCFFPPHHLLIIRLEIDLFFNLRDLIKEETPYHNFKWKVSVLFTEREIALKTDRPKTKGHY